MIRNLLTFVSVIVFLSVCAPLYADVVLDYGPSDAYVSEPINFNRTTSSAGTAPYTFTNAFSDTNPLSPTANYNGPTFHGGYQFTSTTIQKNISRQRVDNDTNPTDVDQILLQGHNSEGWAGTTMSLHGTYVFKQADFNPGYKSGAISLDGLSVEYTGYGSDDLVLTGRFVVEKDDQYYVSQSTIDLLKWTGSYDISGTTLASEQWAIYNPESSLDFDASSAVFNSLNLEQITAIGLYFEDDEWEGGVSQTAFSLGISSFEASGTMIPEPSTSLAMLVAIGCLSLVGRRRTKTATIR